MSVKPILTLEAENKIAEQYSRWRSDKAEAMRSRRALPVTARTLETIIRLATAHAKMRLSKSIDVADATAAIEVMRFAIEAEDTNLHARHSKDRLNSNCDNMASSFATFQTKLGNFMLLKDSVTIEEIERESHSWYNEKFTRDDIQLMLQNLHARNQIMLDNDIVHKV